MPASTWLARAIGTMLAISTAATLFLGTANYASCRANGTGKVACVAISVILSAFEALAFAVMTVVNLITALFP
jgi:hypothetical protein